MHHAADIRQGERWRTLHWRAASMALARTRARLPSGDQFENSQVGLWPTGTKSSDRSRIRRAVGSYRKTTSQLSQQIAHRIEHQTLLCHPHCRRVFEDPTHTCLPGQRKATTTFASRRHASAPRPRAVSVRPEKPTNRQWNRLRIQGKPNPVGGDLEGCCPSLTRDAGSIGVIFDRSMRQSGRG